MPVRIYPDELIVGNITEKRRGAFLSPETKSRWLTPGGAARRLLTNISHRAARFLTFVLSLLSSRLASQSVLLHFLIAKTRDTFDDRPRMRFAADETQKRQIRNTIMPFWKNKSAHERYLSLLSREERELQDKFAYTAENQFAGGVFLFNADFKKVLNQGLSTVMRAAQDKERDLAEGDPKKDFYKAAWIV
jgi:hypothetical protein